MMEIKFRGLSKKGEMIYGSLVNNCVGISHMPRQNTKTWIITSAFGNGGWFNVRGRKYVKPETVGQFTGFLDDKGREAYGGDLVALSEDIGHIPVPDLFEVKWSDDGKWIIYRDRCDFYDLCDYEFRIITNIHQSPELLND